MIWKIEVCFGFRIPGFGFKLLVDDVGIESHTKTRGVVSYFLSFFGRGTGRALFLYNFSFDYWFGTGQAYDFFGLRRPESAL
jgi:hypothetical protein